MDKDLKGRIRSYTLWAIASLCLCALYRHIAPNQIAPLPFLLTWAFCFIFMLLIAGVTFILLGLWGLHKPEDYATLEREEGARRMINTVAATIISVSMFLGWILRSVPVD